MAKRAVGVSGYGRTRNGRLETVRDYIRYQESIGAKPSMKALHRPARKRQPAKPQIRGIMVHIEDDQDPDVSFLEPGMLAGDEEGERMNAERLAAYRRGDFGFAGVYVTADVLVPTGSYDSSGLEVMEIQEIRSGGIWGVENDSEKDYFRTLVAEEVADLAGQLQRLGLKKADVEKALVDDDALDQVG